MLVALFCLAAGLVSMIIFWLHPYLSVAFWLVYVVTYFNAPEKTGRWSLDWLRGWGGWQKVSMCVMQNQKLLEEHHPQRKLLFVAAPNTTLIPMFWSFGLHGQPVMRELDVVFAVPRVLLLIPLLRDILLMAGAVEDDFQTVQRLLSKGRAVCLCPSGLAGYLDDQTPDHTVVSNLSQELAQQCLQSDIHVVPVVFAGETDRYRAYQSVQLRAFQQLCYEQFKYPFPLCFELNREAEVTTMVSAPISPRPFKDKDGWRPFAREVADRWKALGSTPQHQLTVNAAQEL
jgi:hypothetical protein